MYFCYTCCVPLPFLQEKLPQVTLPVQVDIIKHPLEVEGKSTACHAVILAPSQVRLFTYPTFPDYPLDGRTFVLFPSASSQPLSELLEKARPTVSSECDNAPILPFDRLIFIDSTWNQTKRIINDERIARLPMLKITEVQTVFWRYQHGKPSTHLSTIEAIYYTMKEIHNIHFPPYTGEYDNLLFFFKFLYHKIHGIYGDALKAYQKDDVDLRFVR
ncbi:unnamed protein product [Darwinula stevensoni]|uniref:tRNA-uridine aminocarboxypropyltransferase 1 n=1 Tax=Darwinula stevensoni TaxID=69355 RepID=A0A7R9AGV0_9CRUS|nr:unnamed protein product [Darwinula stevensoni]CAG0904074.1 unnamed protein product [Darwinula stevensoni]